MPAANSVTLETKLRLRRDGKLFFGPGKADLLRLISSTGSIAAAAGEMEMSYHHAWVLVREMNRDFRAPLVEVARGGGTGGGAGLTATGQAVLTAFDDAQQATRRAAASGWRKLERYI